jgi:hypothetical protein
MVFIQYGANSERTTKSKTVKAAVTKILSGAGGSKYKAAEIISKILKHPKIVEATEDTCDEKERETKGRELGLHICHNFFQRYCNGDNNW